MNFLAPQFLVGLLLLPLAVLAYLWLQRRRTRYAVRFTNLALLANLAPRRPAWRRHVPPALYLAAIGGLLLALARPTLVIPTPREDATVVLAVDVSGSMNATDVEPTRLEAAKAAASSFLDQLPAGIRVGLVSFSTQPATLVEPTADRATVREALDGLVARGGTAMGDAMMQVLDIAQQVRNAEKAANPSASPSPSPSASSRTRPSPSATPAPSASGSAGTDTPKQPALVAGILLSDGANSVGQTEPLDAAQKAAELGVPMYTIALGTDNGTVEVPDQLGRIVQLDVPPDRETLAQVAEITNAQSFDAPTAEQLKAVYSNLQSRIGYVPREQEVTAGLAAAALILVVAGAGLAGLWFGRLP